MKADRAADQSGFCGYTFTEQQEQRGDAKVTATCMAMMLTSPDHRPSCHRPEAGIFNRCGRNNPKKGQNFSGVEEALSRRSALLRGAGRSAGQFAEEFFE